MKPSERVADIVAILRQQGWYREIEPDDPLLAKVQIDDLINMTHRLEGLLRWLGREPDEETTAPTNNPLIVALLRRLRDELEAIKVGAQSPLLTTKGPRRNSSGAHPKIVQLKVRIGTHAEAFASAYPADNASPRNRAISDAVQAGGHRMAPRTVQHHIDWFAEGRAGALHAAEWGGSAQWLSEFWLSEERDTIRLMGQEYALRSSLESLTSLAREIVNLAGE